jgi:polyferredoxin
MVSKEELDLNGDGVISDEEMQIYLESKRREMEDEDAKRDQQRKMVWFALFGMLLYPLFVFGTEALGFSNASGVIGDMAPTYFMAVSVVVGAFFGADAYVKGKDKNDDKKDKK